MEQVEEICDQIILVNQGKKILDGTVKKVRQDFKQNLFRIGFSSRPVTSNSQTFEIVRQNDDFSHIVKINAGYSPNDVLRDYLQANAEINSFQEILPTLNDIFIQLVEGTPTARQFQKTTAL
jgi:ABC-2 type transport system ATP-binding protein